MSVTLSKYVHAVCPHQGLVYRGDIIRLGTHTVTIRVRSCTGELTGQDLTDIAGGHVYSFPRRFADLYR